MRELQYNVCAMKKTLHEAIRASLNGLEQINSDGSVTITGSAGEIVKEYSKDEFEELLSRINSLDDLSVLYEDWEMEWACDLEEFQEEIEEIMSGELE